MSATSLNGCLCWVLLWHATYLGIGTPADWDTTACVAGDNSKCSHPMGLEGGIHAMMRSCGLDHWLVLQFGLGAVRAVPLAPISLPGSCLSRVEGTWYISVGPSFLWYLPDAQVNRRLKAIPDTKSRTHQSPTAFFIT